ncbi:MAG: hypothetical protein KDA24_27310, partial [Deltaproteobacteria bacterium]|nr:hypothetical protein [Deltaproteobacteria bacterium]
MRRHVLLLAAAMLALPATAQAYTQQLSAQTTSNGQNHTLNFTSLPTGSGTVTLTIGLQGDFSYGNLSNPEGAVITADGAGLGTFIPANDLPSSGDCTGDIYEKDFTFDTSLINNNSAVSIGIDLYAEVGTFCSQNNVFATIVYTANTAPVLSAVSDQTTVEDTADTATFTVSDAEDSNGAVLVSAASSDTAIVSTVSAVNTGGAGTLSWTPVLNANGTATITLTATDSGALTATQTFDITVTPVNDAPVADAGGPYSGGEGSAIAMNGSGST